MKNINVLIMVIIVLFENYVIIVDCENNIFNRNVGKLINGYSDNVEGPGYPLYLTPYIEDGRFEEGRKAAEVQSLIPNKNIKSYSGYLTVNKLYNSNLFFWYFESERNPLNAPTIVWLQGGPGSSALHSVFNENGPYIIANNKTIHKREYYWSKISNLIFFDSPVGTGFSFTDNKSGFAEDESQVGNDLYSAISQIFQLFPNLSENDFYIIGESYAGKYAPALGHVIHRKKYETSTIKINLRGLMIGSAWTDPINMLMFGDYLYQLGLIDNNAKRKFHKVESQIVKQIKKQNWRKATRLMEKLILGDEESLYYKYTGIKGNFNYHSGRSHFWETHQEQFVTSTYFRKSVHVGDKVNHNSSEVLEHLYEDIPKSVINWVVELLNEYRIFFYNGQLDVASAYPLIENFLRKMKWPLRGEYKKAKRYFYKVDNEVAGYYKTVGHLTEALIRGVGHIITIDQPKLAYRLLIDFINNNFTSHGDEISD